MSPTDAALTAEQERQLSYGTAEEQEERRTQAAEVQAARTPTPVESAALSAASIAVALVLSGAILLLLADAVDLVRYVIVWPLVITVLSLIAAIAVGVSYGRLSRRQADELLRAISSPWTVNPRLERVEEKLDRITTLLERSGEPPANRISQ
jgi:VIT1/CCC1 family predicted Fe2+/Mn2+ transporter